MADRKLITRDGRKEVWKSNRMIAYVDDADILFVVDASGHAFPTLDIWRDQDIYDELDKRGL